MNPYKTSKLIEKLLTNSSLKKNVSLTDILYLLIKYDILNRSFDNFFSSSSLLIIRPSHTQFVRLLLHINNAINIFDSKKIECE